MAITDKDIDTIDQYVNGLLSRDDLVKFERRLEQEEAIAQQVVSMRALRHSAKASVLQDKMKMLQHWDAGMGEVEEGEQVEDEELAESVGDSKVRRVPWLKYLAVAASIIGIYFVGKLWMDRNSSVVTEEIYVRMIVAYPDLITTRSEVNNQLDKAMMEYNLGNYEESIKYFDDLKDDEDALFYKSVALIYLNRLTEANNILVSLNRLNYPINYYLGFIEILNKSEPENAQEFCVCFKCTEEMKRSIAKYCMIGD